MNGHRTQFSIEPFAFVGEFAEAENADFAGQEWEDEASRRRQLPRRAARPRRAPVRVWGASDDVRWVQSALNQIMALRLPIDGVMSTETRRAIRSFQARQGLPMDGIVGPDTERALIAARGGKSPDRDNTAPASAFGFEWEAEVSRSSPEYIRAGANNPPSSAGTPAPLAPSAGFFKDLSDLQTVNLSPSSPVVINSGWPIVRRTIASIYNRLGNLMSAVAGKTQIEVPSVLAVWKVEGGNLPHKPGKAVIRFENHLLYRLWGKNNDAIYAQYFRHGGYMGQSGKPWENHQYRQEPNQPFRSSHSNQDAEYLALGLAARLASEEIAIQCISIGGPQILISNYSLIGYRTPREMYNAFQASERSQVLGFFDYCQQKEKGKGGLLPYLRAKDFRNFAYYYNGSGQVDYYGRLIQEAYNEARQMPFKLAPEFEGDFEGEEEWGAVAHCWTQL